MPSSIKKHYKILITILIVIILISSFIVYDITSKKNINYNNNGDKINVKYYSNPDSMPYILSNYTVSSNYVINNKISYINSTIINPCYNHLYLSSELNINLKNTNSKYIYIYFNGLSESPFLLKCKNASLIKTINIDNNYEMKIKINSNNITLYDISMMPYYTGINNYISIKIELNNNFYNLFDIYIIKETTIYGCVGESNTSQVRDYNLNSSFFIENNNTKNFHIVDIRNGYFYFFAKPDTIYKLYYLDKDNGELKEFYHISNNEIKKLNSVTTSSAGNSTPLNIWM